MLPVPRSSDKDALGDLQIWCSGYVSVLGDENTWEATLKLQSP